MATDYTVDCHRDGPIQKKLIETLKSTILGILGKRRAGQKKVEADASDATLRLTMKDP